MTAALDNFGSYVPGLESPVTHIEMVTPNDTVDLVAVSRVLVVSSPGDLGVIMADGSTGTIPAMQAGIWYPARVSRVKVAGTTAGGTIASLS